MARGLTVSGSRRSKCCATWLTSADRDRRKLLKIAGGCTIICCWTARRSAVRARMPEASSTGLNCRHDHLGQASRPDLMRLLRVALSGCNGSL